MTDPIQFDPALKQLLLRKTGDPLGDLSAESAAEEAPVLVRLHDPTAVVPGLQVVSRFGSIVTGRLPLNRIVATRKQVASLKASPNFRIDLATAVPEIRATPQALRRAGVAAWTGRGVVIGVVDWGCDFAHANFRHPDGHTRLRYLWDQRGPHSADSPAPYQYGRELNTERINAALAQDDPYAALGYEPGYSTHGTHVMDIAAGNGRAPRSAPGVAPEADLIFVHLRGNDTRPEDTLGDSVRLLEAVDYIVRRAGDCPVVVNLSLGRTGGPKDATTLVEQALDTLLDENDGCVVSMSTGNYHNANLHSSGRLQPGQRRDLRWQVTPRNDEFAEMEIWYAGADRLSVELIDPYGRVLARTLPGATDVVREQGQIVTSVYNRLQDPNNGDNQINVFLWPEAAVGLWTVRLYGDAVTDGRFHAWIERDSPATQSRFLAADADPSTTIGTICSGRLTISVGAYDARVPGTPLVYFSSAGPSRDGRQVPVISAPGAAIRAARSSAPDVLGRRVMDGTTVKSGSSMAAPFVAGTAALMLQAALPQRLSAASVRRILIETARQDPPFTAVERLRYGAGRLDTAAALRAVEALVGQRNVSEVAYAGAPAVALTGVAAPGETLAMLDTPFPAVPVATAANGRNATAPADAEAASDPVAPVRPDVALRRSVGRRGQNNVADVRAAQAALRNRRYLSAADFTAESPPNGATGRIAEARLAATIAAIEALQRDVLGRTRPDGRIDPGHASHAALNRALPLPTAAAVSAVTRQRAAITETVVRGVALTQPVGRVSDAEVAAGRGNLPAEVRAVQQRLEQLSHLRRDHSETPAAGAAAPRARDLPLTLRAIASFQREVGFWRGRGEVAGAITRQVVAPGDATQRLLDRISSFREQFSGGADIAFRDFVRSRHTRATSGVMFSGTVSPATLPASDYKTMGLTAAQTAALQFVSRHEGKFDALNTYDVARVSLGFIQFAGGRGLPPFMALLKSREAAVFQHLLASFGVDVEFNVRAGRIVNAAVAVLDTSARRYLRGAAAETAVRENKRLSAVLIRAGRDTAVQRTQVEAATRDFVLPALAKRVNGVRFQTLLASEQGLAVLFDRAIQEGVGGGTARLGGAVRWVVADQHLSSTAAAARHEAAVLQQVVDDLTADIDIAARITAAVGALDALNRAAAAAGATVAAILAHGQLAAARRELDTAIAAVPRKSDTPARRRLQTTLRAERARLNFAPPPATLAALRATLTAMRRTLQRARPDTGNARGYRNRVRNILSSTLAAP